MLTFKGKYLLNIGDWGHKFQTDDGITLISRSGEFTADHTCQLTGKEGKQCTFTYQEQCPFSNWTAIAITSNISFT